MTIQILSLSSSRVNPAPSVGWGLRAVSRSSGDPTIKSCYRCREHRKLFSTSARYRTAGAGPTPSPEWSCPGAHPSRCRLPAWHLASSQQRAVNLFRCSLLAAEFSLQQGATVSLARFHSRRSAGSVHDTSTLSPRLRASSRSLTEASPQLDAP
jgi:hypothetical protein